MSRLTPCKRREFIRRLRALGFRGPITGTRHEIMTFGDHRLAIPGYEEYAVPLLAEMLKEVALLLGRDLTTEEWNTL